MHPGSPRAIVATVLSLIDGGRWDELAALYAEDAVVEQPFALPEPVTIKGRDGIAQHFAMAAKMPLTIAVRDIRYTETAEPEVIVAEYRYDLHDPAGNCVARVANIQMVRVVDGRITASRDYHDHHRIGAAFTALRG